MGDTITAPERRPETKSVPGLNDFMKRQREATLGQATSTDQQNTATAGQSEPGKTADQSKGDAKPQEGTASAKTPDGTKTDKREKTAEELKVELSNQAKASLRLGAEKAELQRQLDTLKRETEELKSKVAGTYVEPSKEIKDREAAITAEFEKFNQRREASKADAIKEFGEEAVLSTIYVDESPFATIQKEQPWLVQRVITAERPVHEMMAIVQEQAVLTKFGRTEADVLKKAEEILRPKLFEQFKTELEHQDGGAKPSPTVPSLNRARSAGADPKLGGQDPVRTFSALNLNPHNRV